MKKNLSIFATLLVAVAVFAFLTKTAEADKTVLGSGSLDDTERVKQISLNYLRDNTASRAVGNADELKIKSVEFDELNMAHTKIFQTVNEIPVWEGEAIVHIKSDGSLSTITDNLKNSLVVNTQPNFSAEEATGLAEKMYYGEGNLTEKPSADLWIYRAEDRDHLTYRVEMPRLDGTEHTSIPVIFVSSLRQ